MVMRFHQSRCWACCLRALHGVFLDLQCASWKMSMGYPSGPKLQLGGFLDQRIGLCILPLVKVNDGQLAQRRRARRSTSRYSFSALSYCSAAKVASARDRSCSLVGSSLEQAAFATLFLQVR
jgi:hypothetical protein